MAYPTFEEMLIERIRWRLKEENESEYYRLFRDGNHFAQRTHEVMFLETLANKLVDAFLGGIK